MADKTSIKSAKVAKKAAAKVAAKPRKGSKGGEATQDGAESEVRQYVKVAFFRGASLRPVPPGASKSQDTRYLDIHEDDQLDEAQFTAWVKQASKLPGERM
jgi:hypothetical protein